MKRDIEETLNQLVCVGPMYEISKNIPKTARGIERWAVITVCNKLGVRINDISATQHFNNFFKGHEKPLIEFKQQLMKEFNITEKDLAEIKIMVENVTT